MFSHKRFVAGHNVDMHAPVSFIELIKLLLSSRMKLKRCLKIKCISSKHAFAIILTGRYFICFCLSSLETSPITDSDTAKRTVFQRSYSVVASEYDKQHSPSPARVKAVPRRRVHSGDAGNCIYEVIIS